MTNNMNVSIQITNNVTLSIEGYVAFQSTKNWWEKDKDHLPHWSMNEYFLPLLVEYYQENQSLEANKLKKWILSHSWQFDKWDDQYHLISIWEDEVPSIKVRDPESGILIEEYKSPTVMWEVIRDTCIPVAINYK